MSDKKKSGYELRSDLLGMAIGIVDQKVQRMFENCSTPRLPMHKCINEHGQVECTERLDKNDFKAMNQTYSKSSCLQATVTPNNALQNPHCA